MLLSNILPNYSAHALVARKTQPASVPRRSFHLENLLRNYQAFHDPNEPILRIIPYTHAYSGSVTEGLAYEFYGMSIFPTSVQFWRMETIGLLPQDLRLSEAAALLLHQEFGADNIFWNKPKDCIQIRARLPLTLDPKGETYRPYTFPGTALKEKNAKYLPLIFAGTNLVEAAIYLPRIHRSILSRAVLRQIPEEIRSVSVQIEGPAANCSSGTRALNLRLRLPNPYIVTNEHLDRLVQEALDRSLGNYLNPHTPDLPRVELKAA